MNDRRAAIIAKLKALIDAGNAAIRIRMIDRALAQFAAALVVIGC